MSKHHGPQPPPGISLLRLCRSELHAEEAWRPLDGDLESSGSSFGIVFTKKPLKQFLPFSVSNGGV